MKDRRHFTHPVVAARQATRRRVEGKGEAGFTLIELIIVIAIMPIVVGAISVALVSVLSLQGSVGSRLTDSNDAEVTSATFNRDVQSAAQLTTESSPACGSGTQLLGLEWGANTSSPVGYDTVVSYNTVLVGSTYSLVRQECTYVSGSTLTPGPAFTIAHDAGNATQGPPQDPTISTSSGDVTPTTTWISTQGITGVTFTIDAPGSGYNYTLVGLPTESSSTGAPPGQGSTPPVSDCGYATPNALTYWAKSLCFVNFNFLNTADGDQLDNDGVLGGATGYPVPPNSAAGCQQVTEGISNTPYTLSFCISEAANNTGSNPNEGPVTPWIIPTYYDPALPPNGDGSEAYLGNNGFYTGIPGDPALYQWPTGLTSGGGYQSTIYITDIQVTDSVGQPANDWNLVTGDAESTDADEYVQWQTNTASPLTVFADNPATGEQYGNDCYDTSTGVAGDTNDGLLALNDPSAGDTTTLGSNGWTDVECEASLQLDKTGTIMLQATAPTSLTVTMKGAGLQAFFLAVFL